MDQIFQSRPHTFIGVKKPNEEADIDLSSYFLQINEVLPVAFCPVCMFFMCTKHLESKSEKNAWVFERIR